MMKTKFVPRYSLPLIITSRLFAYARKLIAPLAGLMKERQPVKIAMAIGVMKGNRTTQYLFRSSLLDSPRGQRDRDHATWERPCRGK